MTIDDYIEQRNELYLKAESVDSATGTPFGKKGPLADLIWTELGVANRHIERVLNGKIKLKFVEKEIDACLKRVSGLQASTLGK